MFLMNMFRHMDHSRIVFDFLLQSDVNRFADELASYGSRVYRIPSYYKNVIQNHKQLKAILTENNYQAIHVHANGLFYITPILYGKKLGVPIRVIHSHSDFIYYRLASVYHNFNRRRVEKSATNFFACSEQAGKWMFHRPFRVIPNAVDLDAFAFDESRRQQYRAEFGAGPGTLILGQVGRLTAPKNHAFSLELFSCILKAREDSLLILVGEGELESSIRQKARNLGIEGKVLFLGPRDDVSAIQNAFDVALLPSLYEGLGIVAIEAQANGLPLFCSDAVPASAVIAENCWRLTLGLGAEKWAERILASPKQRTHNKARLVSAGYDIQSAAQALQGFYLTSEWKQRRTP